MNLSVSGGYYLSLDENSKLLNLHGVRCQANCNVMGTVPYNYLNAARSFGSL